MSKDFSLDACPPNQELGNELTNDQRLNIKETVCVVSLSAIAISAGNSEVPFYVSVVCSSSCICLQLALLV